MKRYHLDLPPAPLQAETLLDGALYRVRIGPAKRASWGEVIGWALIALTLAAAPLVPDASPPTP